MNGNSVFHKIKMED